MDVVSLFDGVSCAMVALQRAGITVRSYTAYEIDKYAIQISKKNHSTIVHRGDVKTLSAPVPCDLLIGGSPCTDLSIAKRGREGLRGTASSLFWEYVRIKNLLNPRWFILENVASMKEADKNTITEALGVDPIMIDAGLVSAQRRKRYFWTNIPVDGVPNDREISVGAILQPTVAEKYFINPDVMNTESKSQAYRVYPLTGKSVTLNSGGGGIGAKTGLYRVGDRVRKLTPIECERLQGLPDNYTEGVSDTQRYKCCGNAFNVDVIAHILDGIPE